MPTSDGVVELVAGSGTRGSSDELAPHELEQVLHSLGRQIIGEQVGRVVLPLDLVDLDVFGLDGVLNP